MDRCINTFEGYKPLQFPESALVHLKKIGEVLLLLIIHD
jgi:hypothetical protein